MEVAEKKSGIKWLIVLLCLLVFVIVGLVIGITAAMNANWQNEVYDDSSDPGVEALTIQEDISEKYANDPEYSLGDAMNEYEYEMSVGSNAKRVYIAIDYAGFVYDTYEDIDMVVEIMQKVEPLLGDDMSASLDYYIAMANFYESAGDSVMAEKYNKIVFDMTPEISTETKNKLSGGDGNEEE